MGAARAALLRVQAIGGTPTLAVLAPHAARLAKETLTPATTDRQGIWSPTDETSCPPETRPPQHM